MDTVLAGIADTIILGFAHSYGLDWITMFFGVLGGYLMTQKDKRGILSNIVACSASFALALISHQYGFLISNLLTMAIMIRAYASWSAEARQSGN